MRDQVLCANDQNKSLFVRIGFYFVSKDSSGVGSLAYIKIALKQIYQEDTKEYTYKMNKVPYKAPDFTLIDENNNQKSLKDLIGNWVVLYFYPKDDTPGCTIEACSLRDARDDLMDMGVEIVGISKDSVDSHDKFKAKHSLNFTLLSDESGETIKAYGAWGKKMFGVEGIQRKTFLIDPEGVIQKVYGKVTPVGHGAQVIKDLKALQNK